MDIDYLIGIRDKSAHFKVGGDPLYTPKDYQVRMLICSIYEHILSVRVPFIEDLYTVVKANLDSYASFS